MNARTKESVEAFAALDPVRVAPRADAAAGERLLRAITSTPRSVASSNRRRRWQPRSVGLGIAILALVGAGSVAALNSGLPTGNDMISKSPAEARQEVQTANAAIPVAPGERDPGPGTIDENANYAQGAAAGQLLFRRMCTWDKRLLQAIAADDTATIATTKAELARPLWYTYFAPSSGDYVRSMHAQARSGRTRKLEQFYNVNCREITG